MSFDDHFDEAFGSNLENDMIDVILSDAFKKRVKGFCICYNCGYREIVREQCTCYPRARGQVNYDKDDFSHRKLPFCHTGDIRCIEKNMICPFNTFEQKKEDGI